MHNSHGSSSIEESLNWLFQQFPSYQLIGSKAFKPTLDNTHKILEFLNHPEKHLKFIHIAGSNGKGSVSSYLASILTESGLKVGLFTSPHISHFSERIRVNGKQIDNDAIISFIDEIRQSSFNFSPSFFEITFGMALQHFHQNECDICIIETGLGGRLDATNVIRPEVSIITSISLEHTDMLGDTIEAIAGEKAGIIKNQVPVVLGKGCEKVQSVFNAFAHNSNSEIHLSPALSSRWMQYFPARYQQENFACVLKTLELLPYSASDKCIEQGIKKIVENTGFFGRYQVMDKSPEVIFDVAHNADGIAATLELALNKTSGDLHLIYASSKDKDLKTISAVIPGEIHFYGTQFSNQRSLPVTELKSHFNRIDFKSSAYFENGPEALKAARHNASEADTILVLGSFFLLSDFF